MNMSTRFLNRGLALLLTLVMLLGAFPLSALAVGGNAAANPPAGNGGTASAPSEPDGFAGSNAVKITFENGELKVMLSADMIAEVLPEFLVTRDVAVLKEAVLNALPDELIAAYRKNGLAGLLGNSDVQSIISMEKLIELVPIQVIEEVFHVYFTSHPEILDDLLSTELIEALWDSIDFDLLLKDLASTSVDLTEIIDISKLSAEQINALISGKSVQEWAEVLGVTEEELAAKAAEILAKEENLETIKHLLETEISAEEEAVLRDLFVNYTGYTAEERAAIEALIGEKSLREWATILGVTEEELAGKAAEILSNAQNAAEVKALLLQEGVLDAEEENTLRGIFTGYTGYTQEENAALGALMMAGDLSVESVIEVLGLARAIQIAGPSRLVDMVGADRLLALVDLKEVLPSLNLGAVISAIGVNRVEQILGTERVIAIAGASNLADMVGIDNLLALVDIKELFPNLDTATVVTAVGVERIQEILGEDLEDSLLFLGVEKFLLEATHPLEFIQSGPAAIIHALNFSQIRELVSVELILDVYYRISNVSLNGVAIGGGTSKFRLSKILEAVLESIPSIETFKNIPANGVLYSMEAVVAYDPNTLNTLEPGETLSDTRVKLTLGVYGDEKSIEYLEEKASTLSKYIHYDIQGDGTVKFDVVVPERVVGLLTRVLSSDRVPEALKKKSLKALSADIDTLITYFENLSIDDLQVYVDQAIEHGLIDRVNNAVDTYQSKIEKIRTYIVKALRKIPAQYRSRSLVDYYSGNGLFGGNLAEDIKVATVTDSLVSRLSGRNQLLDKVLGQIDLFLETEDTVNLDLTATIRLPGLYQVTLQGKDKVLFRTFLPVGAKLSLAFEAAGLGGETWYDEAGHKIAADAVMTAGDVVFHDDLRNTVTFLDLAGNVLKTIPYAIDDTISDSDFPYVNGLGVTVKWDRTAADLDLTKGGFITVRLQLVDAEHTIEKRHEQDTRPDFNFEFNAHSTLLEIQALLSEREVPTIENGALVRGEQFDGFYITYTVPANTLALYYTPAEPGTTVTVPIEEFDVKLLENPEIFASIKIEEKFSYTNYNINFYDVKGEILTGGLFDGHTFTVLDSYADIFAGGNLPTVPTAIAGYRNDGQWKVDPENDGIYVTLESYLASGDRIGDLDVFAKYTPVQYHVSFVNKAGTVVYPASGTPFTYTVETPIANVNAWAAAAPEVADLTAKGYSSDRVWYYNNGALANYSFAITANTAENVVFAAKYTPISYQLHFFDRNGISLSTYQASFTVDDHYSALTIPNPPAVTGYNNATWVVKVNGAEVLLSEYLATGGKPGDLDVFAKYDKIKYTVQFLGKDNSVVDSFEYYADTTPADLAAKIAAIDAVPTLTGYTSDGIWYQGTTALSAYDFTVKNDTKTLVQFKATYTANQYSLKFYNQAGTLIATVQYTVENKYSDLTGIPTVPTVTGYSNSVWKVTVGGVKQNLSAYLATAGKTGDLNVTADYEKITYKVVFKDKKGDKVYGFEYDSTTAPTVLQGYIAAIPSQADAVPGYSSDRKWYTGNTALADYSFAITANTQAEVVFQAKYTLINYTVTFTHWDGTVETKPFHAENMASFTLPTITYDTARPQNKGYTAIWVKEDGTPFLASALDFQNYTVTTQYTGKATVKNYFDNAAVTITFNNATEFATELAKKTSSAWYATYKWNESYSEANGYQLNETRLLKKLKAEFFTNLKTEPAGSFTFYYNDNKTAVTTDDKLTDQNGNAIVLSSLLPSAPDNVPNGYSFPGWGKEADILAKLMDSKSYTDVAGTLTVTFEVETKAIEYTITFEGKGTEKYTVADLPTAAELLAKYPGDVVTGKKFLGWYVKGTTTKLDANYGFTATTGNVTFTAKYEDVVTPPVNEYTITFEGTTETVKYQENTAPTQTFPTVPAKPGYTGGAWYVGDKKLDSSYTYTKGDLTAVAKGYIAVEYTVTFKADGKQVGEVFKYTVEKLPTAQSFLSYQVPEKDGYTAGEWMIGDKKLSQYTFTKDHLGNVEVTVTYTKATYTIYFKSEGQTLGTLTYQIGDKVDLTKAPAAPENTTWYVGSQKLEDYEFTFGDVTVSAKTNELPPPPPSDVILDITVDEENKTVKVEISASETSEKTLEELLKEGVLLTDAFDAADEMDYALEIKAGTAKVTLNAVAAGALNASGNVQYKTYRIKQQSDATGNYTALGYNADTNYLYEITFLNPEAPETAASLGEGGKATVEIEYAAQNAEIVHVFYISPEGTEEDMAGTYADGKVSFETSHFSTYLILEKAEQVEPEASLWWIWLIVVLVVLIVVAVLLYLFIFRKKPEEPTEEPAAEETETLEETEPEEIIEEIEEEVVEEEAEEAAEEAAEEETETEEAEEEVEEVAEKTAFVPVEDHTIYVEDVDDIMEDEAAIEQIHYVRKVHTGMQAIINVDTLDENFDDGDKVSMELLKTKKLIPQKSGRLKILARGSISKALHTEADSYSIQAVKMIELAGGTVTWDVDDGEEDEVDALAVVLEEDVAEVAETEAVVEETAEAAIEEVVSEEEVSVETEEAVEETAAEEAAAEEKKED